MESQLSKTKTNRATAPFPQLCYRILIFMGALLWQEMSYRLFCQTFLGRGLVHTVLFVLPMGCLFGLLTAFLSARWNLIVAKVLLSLTTLWFIIQSVYHTIFGTVLVTSSFNMAGDAIGSYWKEALGGVVDTLPLVFLLALPLVLLMVFGQNFCWRPVTKRQGGAVAGAMAVLQLVAVLSLNVPTSGLMSMREIYRQSFIPDLTASNFGLLTTLRLDLTMGLIGLEEGEDSILEPVAVPPQAVQEGTPPVQSATDTASEQPPASPAAEEPIVYPPNIMDIDFETLIAEETSSSLAKIHTYIASKTPTLQNEYTGIFEGKNLIFITAEAFWIGAVSEEYTPTLYKLSQECFVFNNFYNPLWYYSTVDGEYAATTGLVPSNQVNASQKYAGANEVSMYFSMGNQLSALGYPTMAYHNNTSTYYNRYLSHPNLGYEFYAGDTGLDVDMGNWPQSDLEMMEATIPQALAGELPFHNYYMTVSGHLQYNFVGNDMSIKNRDAVADAPYSDGAKAYLACNIELDKALEYTLDQLEQAGELENTVIVLSGDHYPYGLDSLSPAIDELTQPGTQKDPLEIHHSTLILWSGDLATEEPVVVDKLCSSIDILPTLLNLFGLEYDSRLLAGRDILSTAEGYVPFNNRSYISELGRYDASTDTFTPNEGVEIPEGYATSMYQRTTNLLNYSSKMLFADYYRELGLIW